MKRNLVDYRKVQKVDLDGYRFDSKAEAELYVYLKALQADGVIRNLKLKPRVQIYIPYTMIPDFSAEHAATGKLEYHEMKGHRDERWRRCKRGWIHSGPAPLLVYRPGKFGPRFEEVVTPNEDS